MKKTIKLVAIVTVIAMLAVSLVSCGKILSGSYSSTTEFFGTTTTVTYEFKGSDYTVTTVTSVGTLSNTTTQSGTYEIKEDPENSDAFIIVLTTTVAKDDGSTSTTSTEHSFSEGTENNVKYIKIGNTQYNAVK